MLRRLDVMICFVCSRCDGNPIILVVLNIPILPCAFQVLNILDEDILLIEILAMPKTLFVLKTYGFLKRPILIP